ncbi:cation diffusion facilitator family transporter [Cytobacillus sp. IB215665]|uniref:cation diffusion facilitator family transporter n=1 Tax=Cytobacillus sp. IB215665 TaxID=3097357 RepID=UPI002A161C52|nr:cation diffusion facilitator family transporter [Cytobacillus sp. IB215665]MDX8364718.1 cation diffusion facilitator family transporter [Cytobacillus sp. IB215665]
MGHSHAHHDHGHSHTHNVNKKTLKISFFIISTYMIIEVIGGVLTNSLALLSDAGHMLSDAAALGLSFLAMKFGEKQPTLEKTFGYRRFEILAALLNGVTLVIISIYIFWEAYNRLLAPPHVISKGMLIISSIGLLVNIIVAFILLKGDTSDNLNIRSAFLHVLGDLLGSVGAIIAALLIMFFGWNLADPIASVVVAILIIISAWRVTRDSLHILMEGSPPGVDVGDIKEQLLSISHVIDVHDLHVWAISSDFLSLSCHIKIGDCDNYERVLNEATKLLKDKYHINHTTIQIDHLNSDCSTSEVHCN